MAIQKENGSVSIEAQNIMPVIKRWLYSDKDIFLREAVSNGCDAITKFRMLHPDSGEEMRVTVSVDKEKKIIRISDTGIGMSPEFMETMYQPFSRQIDSRVNSIQGTGLGLAITRNAVLMHRGSITVTSKEGEGSCFVVKIPLTYISA